MADDLRALSEAATPWTVEYESVFDCEGSYVGELEFGSPSLSAAAVALVNAYADGSLITREEAEREYGDAVNDARMERDEAVGRIEAEKRVLEDALEAADALALEAGRTLNVAGGISLTGEPFYSLKAARDRFLAAYRAAREAVEGERPAD